MNQISRCDWLPEQARWSYLARSGYRLCPAKKIYHVLVFYSYDKSFIDQACSDIGLVLFLRVFCVSVHKHAKKVFDQYPAILTSCSVNNPYLLFLKRLHLTDCCCKLVACFWRGPVSSRGKIYTAHKSWKITENVCLLFFPKILQNTILACCSQALIRMVRCLGFVRWLGAHHALNYRTNWARTKSYSASRSYFAVVIGVTSFPWVFRTGWWVVLFGALKSTSTTKNNTLVLR